MANKTLIKLLRSRIRENRERIANPRHYDDEFDECALAGEIHAFLEVLNKLGEEDEGN